MAVALVGGAAIGALFGVLYDVVKESMGRTVMRYKPLLEDLKFTLDCLRPRIIQEIGDHNVALGLPNDDIERLQQQMEEGIKLLDRLSKLSMWNCYILCSCCKCSKPSYTDRLIQLDRSLRALLEVLRLQEARDMKENLLLNRKIYEKQDELATRQSEILKIAGEILRAQQEARGVQELSGSSTQTLVVQEKIGGSGVQQAASINGGGAALAAVFEILFSAVLQTKEKTRMFKRILGHLKSTLDSIKPLIEEIAECNKVFHLTEEELESLRVEMEKGVELVRKCSKVSLWASNKKYEYTNKLLGLDESLQRLINILRVQLARDARESLVSVTNIETVTKQVEESGMIQYDQTESRRPLVELPSTTVGLDVLSVQGAGKMTKARELEEGAKKIEGSGVVQNQTEIHGSSNTVSMEESETEFEPQQVFSSEFGTIHENTQGSRPDTSPRFSNWFSRKAKKRGKSGSENEQKHVKEISAIYDVNIYAYKELRNATENFGPANKIGEGGFGSVYKGRLKDGTMAAVKVLSAGWTVGPREFLNEIQVVSKIMHKNIVRLYGCCCEGNRTILVYEYLENKSLAQTLFGEGKNHVQFSWQTRREICIGVANGLAFLHEYLRTHVIHGDIKASNILLDKYLEPKISDFGLAKLNAASKTHASTHVAGAIGYIAPEYAIRGQLTRKADVYSFGVLLLEIVSGRCNTNTQLDGQYLLERTWQLYEQRALVGLVDTSMSDDCDTEEACRFLQIGLICTQDSPKLRPHMTTVIKMLTGEVDVNDCKISKPSLISDFMNLEVRDPASSVSIQSSAPMSSLQSSSKTSH
ncbi:hypothetical protein PS1_038742 [Malus domestica]